MMLTATRPVNRGQRSSGSPFPAPVGGWNARDALADMPVNMAVAMDNFFPSFGRVSMRRGYTSWATGCGGMVKTLAEFNAGASRKMIACASGSIWDVSTNAAATSLASGFTQDAWQHGQFDDAGGGARMGLVNGADAPQTYDGATVAAMTVSGVGLTVANLIGIHIHNNKSYFWEKNSQNFWYSATNALGGVLTKFNLGRLSGFGGNLVKMDTWSIDAGNGPNDLAVFLMDSGDVIVYAGTDPGSATAWSLVGKYHIGPAIGYRPTVKIGAELYAITKSGYQPMSQVAKLGEQKQNVVLSDMIRSAVNTAVEGTSSLGGWQAVLYPKGNYCLFNYPISTSIFEQHIVNTETGAWTRFRGMDGYCWSRFNDALYFGGNGTVYKADNGFSDGGIAVQADCMTAWNYLGTPGRLKDVGMCRILGSTTNGQPIPYSLSLGLDFKSQVQAISNVIPSSNTAPWDTSPWNTTPWPSESAIFDSWGGVNGLGDAVSARLRVASNSSGFDWYSTTYAFQLGGII